MTRPLPRPEPPIRKREWHAHIVPADHWGWHVHITHGATYVGEGAHWSPTKDRAERWARRRIAKGQARDQRREAQTIEVTA